MTLALMVIALQGGGLLADPAPRTEPPAPGPPVATVADLDALRSDVATLRAEVNSSREQIADLRRQLDEARRVVRVRPAPPERIPKAEPGPPPERVPKAAPRPAPVSVPFAPRPAAPPILVLPSSITPQRSTDQAPRFLGPFSTGGCPAVPGGPR